MKPAPCGRHQPRSLGYSVHLMHRGMGQVLSRYAVYEGSECTRCGEKMHRLLGTPRAEDGWEAARLAGVPEASLGSVNVRVSSDEPAPAAQATSEPVARPLKCWPFPVSSRKEYQR